MEWSWTPTLVAATVAIVISIFALVVAALSLLISYWSYRKGIDAEKPLLTTIIRAVPGQPHWHEITTTLQSRSTYGWHCDELRFIWPPGAKAIPGEIAFDKAHAAGEPPRLKNPLPRALAKRRVSLNLEVTRAGQAVPKIGTIALGVGEVHSRTLFVFARSIWLRKLSMRASLRSNEPIERHMPIAIKRTLPHAVKTASA